MSTRVNTAVAVVAAATLGLVGVASNPPAHPAELPGSGCAIPDCREFGGWGKHRPNGPEVDCRLTGPFAKGLMPQWYGCGYVAPRDHTTGTACVPVACEYKP